MDGVIQIYGRRKCPDTRKAERFFRERRVAYQLVDIDVKSPGARELELFASVLGAEQLLDTQGKRYRERGLAYMEFDALSEIGEDPALLRTPIVRSGREVSIGPDTASWEKLATQDSG